MNPLFGFFLARLSEPSTWAGIGILAHGIGPAIATQDYVSIIQSVGGLIAIFAPEQGPALSSSKGLAPPVKL